MGATCGADRFCIWHFTRFLAAATLVQAACFPVAGWGQDFGAQANGNWSNAATWTPAGGPPGAGQTALIGSNFPLGSALNATVTLTANQPIHNLELGRTSGGTGTLNLNGRVLTVTGTIFVGRFGGTGVLNHNGGHFTATTVDINSGNSLTFEASDVTSQLLLSTASTASTTSSGNITQTALLNAAGTTLSLGDELNLALDLDIRGSGGVAATVNANGNDITARDIYIGHFNQPGTILNDGAITATRDLWVSVGTFTLDANDSVTDTVAAVEGGTLNLHANTAADNAFVEGGATLNMVATGNVSRRVELAGAGSLFNMGADLALSEDLDIRGSGGTAATVNANGNDITARDIYIGRFSQPGSILNDGAITATRDLSVSVGSFTLDANDSVADTVAAVEGGTLNLHANTAADNAFVGGGATLNMVATGNVSRRVEMAGAGGLFNMGADLVLSEDLDLRGSGGTAATVNANGNDITARDIYIGRFAQAGSILNDGAITATRDLSVSVGSFTLDANDSVADTVAAVEGGTLNLHANTAADNAFVGGGATLNMVATGNVSRRVEMAGAGGLFNMGADLVLSEDLDLRGSGGTAATVNANGNDITARDIYIGRFAQAGSILNDGAITATRDLSVSVGSFTLDANDSVADTVAAVEGGTLNLHANTAADNAFVGGDATLHMVATSNVSRRVEMAGAGGLFNMGAKLALSEDLDIRGSGGMAATVNANGHDITARDIYIGRFVQPGSILNDGAITATRDLSVSVGSFTLDANDSVADTVAAVEGGTLNLHANTAADNAFVGAGATMNAVATGNVSRRVEMAGAGGLFNMGAGLVLSEDLEIRGSGGTIATVNANGHDVTARDIFVGHFAQPGALVNSGRLIANRNLKVELSQLDLNGGLDVVGQTLTIVDGSTLNVNQDADNVRGLSLEGTTLSILDTSVLALTFDNMLSPVADWVFRWAGEHVADINALIGNGRITVSSPHSFIVTNNGDGYTYISNFQGDFNGDNQISCPDIDMLTAAVASGSTDLMFDLTGDGLVTVADRDAWLAGAGAAFLDSGNPYLPGDANLDGSVNGADFLIWNQNKFTSTPAWCGGDFDASGIVNGADFLIWNQFKFQSADGTAMAVPEPAMPWPGIILGLLLISRRVSPRLAPRTYPSHTPSL